MDRTGLRGFTKIATLCAVFGMLLAAPASAQIFGRNGPVCADGEPTDPDSAFRVHPYADVNGTDYGLTSASPRVQTQARPLTHWFDALLAFLRNLGLLPAKGGN